MTTSMNVKTGTSKKRQAAPDPVKYERMTAKMAFQLAMIHTWPASVCPALFGIFWCLFRGISLTPAQCILLAAACILSQSSVNTLNDYVDYVNGTDSEEDNVEVNDAVLVYNHLNPRHALILGLAYLASAALCGVAAARHSGPAPYVVGIIGICRACDTERLMECNIDMFTFRKGGNGIALDSDLILPGYGHACDSGYAVDHNLSFIDKPVGFAPGAVPGG